MSLGSADARAELEAFFRDELRAAEAGAPSPDDLAAYVDGALRASEREVVELALADDAALRQEVADLMALRAALAAPARLTPLRASVGLALAACVVAGVTALWLSRTWRPSESASNATPVLPSPLFSLRDAGGPLSLRADGSLGGAPLDGLPADVRARVAAALRRGQAQVPASVGALRGRRLTLMGGPSDAAGPFALLLPIATVVRSDRPSFAWRAHPQARAYVVSIYDDELNPRASSAELGGTTWTCPVALPRGRVFVWQVAALTPSGRVIAPRPPLPDARFTVLGAGEAAALEASLRAAPGSHLAAGVLLAEAGVLDEAERELRALAAANPGRSEVQNLLAGLRRR